MLKVLGMIIIASTSSIFANDFGTYTQRAKLHLQQEQVKAIISASTLDRESAAVSRDLASFTASPQDKAWADEYENLMNNQSEQDYLKLAADL